MLLVETLVNQPPQIVGQVPNQQAIDPTTGQPVQLQQVNGSEEVSPEEMPPEEAPPEEGNPDLMGIDPDDMDSDLDGEESSDFAAPPVESPEILPLKKYYLIQKIIDLNAKLTQKNIVNSDLDNIMKFMDNLSYNTLLSLITTILPDIEEQLVRIINNEKTIKKSV